MKKTEAQDEKRAQRWPAVLRVPGFQPGTAPELQAGDVFWRLRSPAALSF